MARSRKKQTEKPKLEAYMIYEKEDAVQILGLTEQEFNKLNIIETELRPGGDIVYDFRDLWPHVFNEEYQESWEK